MRKRVFWAVFFSALLLVFSPAVHAGVGIGLAAYSDTPILAAEDVNTELLEGNFTYGANGRIKFGRLNLDALGLYSTAVPSIDLYLTAQLSYDLFIFRLSGGVGPALHFPLSDDTDPFDDVRIDWLNAKVDFDIVLGRISAGLSFQYLVPSKEAQQINFDEARGRIGVSLILW